MDGSWWTFVDIGLRVATFVVAFLVIPIWRALTRIRTNDLEHLASDVKDVHAAVEKVGEKLDGHILWHLNRGGDRVER